MNKYEEKMRQLGAYYVGEGQLRRLTQADIQPVEQQLACDLPDDYAEFLADYGCHAFDRYVEFPLKEEYPEGDRGTMNVFFGVMPGSTYDLFYNRRTYKGRIPDILLPIANDIATNIICLSVAGEEKGAVYLWDREEEEDVGEGAEPGFSNVYLIAESFDEFINSLKPAADAG